MKGCPILYSAEEMAWLEANRLMVISDYARAFAVRFRREVDAKNLHALRERKGWKTGRTGCFEKGEPPYNKGKKCAPGTGGLHPNARKTQFKKGHAPHNTNYLGHRRIDPKDGYIYLSVAEANPHTGYERRYVLEHKWLWEQKNGPLPAGHALKCLDSNRQNTDPSNWEAVPRTMLPRLAGKVGRYRRCLAYDDAAPELKPALLAIARLSDKARARRDSDATATAAANGDLPVPQDLQARAESIAQTPSQ